MRLLITVKRLGSKKALLTEKPYDIPSPSTLRALIAALVEAEVADYNAKPEDSPDGDDSAPPPLSALLTEEAIADKAATGKIDFARRRNRREDPAAAVARAVAAFEDGLYRVFVGDAELDQLDQAIALRDGDRLTLIRLTMLTGR